MRKRVDDYDTLSHIEDAMKTTTALKLNRSVHQCTIETNPANSLVTVWIGKKLRSLSGTELAAPITVGCRILRHAKSCGHATAWRDEIRAITV